MYLKSRCTELTVQPHLACGAWWANLPSPAGLALSSELAGRALTLNPTPRLVHSLNKYFASIYYVPGTEDAVLSEEGLLPALEKLQVPLGGGQEHSLAAPHQILLSILPVVQTTCCPQGLPTARLPFSQELGDRPNSRPFATDGNGPPHYGPGLVPSLVCSLALCRLSPSFGHQMRLAETTTLHRGCRCPERLSSLGFSSGYKSSEGSLSAFEPQPIPTRRQLMDRSRAG